MSLQFTTSYVQTNVPGAYANVNVINTPAGIGTAGVVTIIGEASGGPSYSQDPIDLASNFYSPSQAADVAKKYLSGSIVDAMYALTSPSADANIQGAPTGIFIVKTNSGLQASSILTNSAGNYGTLKDKNYGLNGNNIKYQVTATSLEAPAKATSDVISAYGAALNGDSFTVRVNGGAAQVITLSNTPADHANRATLMVELNALFAAASPVIPITVTAGVAADTIVLTMATDANNYAKGFGKAFELVDSTPGDLAAIGLTDGLYSPATQSAVELNVINQLTNTNEILNAAGDIGLKIGYLGTTATLTINATTLTTTVVGGAGASLSIQLSQYPTIAALASFISSQAGYTATATTVATQLPTSALDQVTTVGIAVSDPLVQSGQVKIALYNFKKAAATSGLTTFSAIEAAGLPAPMASFVFLSGGTLGGTSNADVLAALQKAEKVQTNFIVPLFSEDASADIVKGLTASSSTYTIAAINALAKSHVIQMSTPFNKHYRQAVCSYEGLYADAKAQAQSLANYRCSLAFQQVYETNSVGDVTLFAPWYGAVIAAGMQAAGFYKGITNKYANIISFVDPTGFDSSNAGALEGALNAGLLILQKDNAGDKWISDQTSYGYDASFVYNSMQAVYLSDVATITLIDGVQKTFIGQSVADVTAGSVKAYVQSLMAQFKQLKIISGSADAPLGYKNLVVSVNGPVILIDIELKLSSTIFFAGINISLSQVSTQA